ncbi:MAG: hypothetical protein FWC28_02095 [Proteobacteria bacterium]|nr:hypothetical protein [Cystobacterineae bacterium]MCL2259030.1 hypothetical protein [Cystobacterineae bacterium]MCL2314029.1 hypothetical protein [Pseudomonadota bacterium]
MDKILLLSVIIMMVILPMRAAKIPQPGLALRKAMFHFFAYNVFYWIAVVFIYFFVIQGRDAQEILSKTVHD